MQVRHVENFWRIISSTYQMGQAMKITLSTTRWNFMQAHLEMC